MSLKPQSIPPVPEMTVQVAHAAFDGDAQCAASAAQELESWKAYTRDMTVWKLERMVKELEGRYEKYLPPEPDEQDDDPL